LAKRGYTYFTRFAYPILYVALSYGKECAGYGQAVAEQGEGIRRHTLTGQFSLPYGL
jgi:hypothetical protein